jgi:hypothetical protein
MRRDRRKDDSSSSREKETHLSWMMQGQVIRDD